MSADKPESREAAALRELNEATSAGFSRSRRGGGNIRVVIEDDAEGERIVDVDSSRSNVRRVRYDPPRRP